MGLPREKTTYWSGDISASNTLNGGIEVVESLALDDLRANLTANTKLGETSLDDHESE